MAVGQTHNPRQLSASRSLWDSGFNKSYHVALVHLGTHGQLDDEPGGVAQDEGGDEVPVDDVPQAADAPARTTQAGDTQTSLKEGNKPCSAVSHLPACLVSFKPFLQTWESPVSLLFILPKNLLTKVSLASDQSVYFDPLCI